MALFPPATVLIVPPSQNYSRGKTATLNSPLNSRYAASRVLDGSVGTHARSAFGTDVLTVDLGAAHTPNIFGVFQHNVDWDLVCGFQASATNFGTLLLDRGAAARRPHFWIDLRGFPATARYWRVVVNASSKPLTIGEVVIAEGYEFTGSLVDPGPVELQARQERAELEYGKITVSASGAYNRKLALKLRVDGSQMDQLLSISAEVAATPRERVIVVPNTRRNEIFFVEWPAKFEGRYPKSDRDQIEVTLDLVEPSGGVV